MVKLKMEEMVTYNKQSVVICNILDLTSGEKIRLTEMKGGGLHANMFI